MFISSEIGFIVTFSLRLSEIQQIQAQPCKSVRFEGHLSVCLFACLFAVLGPLAKTFAIGIPDRKSVRRCWSIIVIKKSNQFVQDQSISLSLSLSPSLDLNKINSDSHAVNRSFKDARISGCKNLQPLGGSEEFLVGGSS
jgi:hypothetical protein